jgi:hypothetical protein
VPSLKLEGRVNHRQMFMGKPINIQEMLSKKEGVISGHNECYAVTLKLFWSYVELNSTPLSALPDPVSSSNRHIISQCFMFVFPKLLPCNGCV